MTHPERDVHERALPADLPHRRRSARRWDQERRLSHRIPCDRHRGANERTVDAAPVWPRALFGDELDVGETTTVEMCPQQRSDSCGVLLGHEPEVYLHHRFGRYDRLVALVGEP